MTNNLHDLIAQAETNERESYNNLLNAKETMRALERENENARHELKRLKNILKSASYTSPIGQWFLDNEQDENRWDNQAWTKGYVLRTTTYNFRTWIKEVTNLKKMKFVVKIYGEKTYNGYTDYDYLKEKYCSSWEYKNGRQYTMPQGMELEKKFSSVEDATKFMHEWQERLLTDHKEEIENELSLISSVK